MSELSREAQATEAASRRQLMLGTLAGLASYLLWTLNFVFYKQLVHVPIAEVLAQRTVWAAVFIVILVTLVARWPHVMVHVRNRKTLCTLIMTGWLIGGGWLLLVWMTMVGRGIEVSIGQFVAPLGGVLAGIFLLHERPNMAQMTAVTLATGAVAWFVYGLGYVPIIAIFIPFSFVAYTYLRKTMQVEPLDGLLVELVSLMPLGLVWIFFMNGDAPSALTWDWWTTALLLWTGPMTVVPLLLFIYAARHVSLTALGFMQYILPTGTFLFAVLLYGETLTSTHVVIFGLIWTGLIIFTADAWRRERALRRPVSSTVTEPLL